MYVEPNYKRKKFLREALELGVEVRLMSPGVFDPPRNGRVGIEGPHEVPHTWYATVEVVDGLVKRIIE